MDVLRRIRWSVLVIALALVGIVIVDMIRDGDAQIALIAIGGLIGISKEIINDPDPVVPLALAEKIVDRIK